jgi:hypothetical protein
MTQKLFDIHKKQKNEKIWGFFHGNHDYKIPQISRAYLENTMCTPNNITFMGSRGVLGLEIKHNKKILDINLNWYMTLIGALEKHGKETYIWVIQARFVRL